MRQGYHWRVPEASQASCMPPPAGDGGADSDADEGGAWPAKDEYGEPFEDYGFLKRAEEHKQGGNADFKNERYEKALKEYEAALDQLLTVAYDKSIIIGKRKWNDVVVLRSTIHLNKSTCYYKLSQWRKAADEECLVGNMRETMMYTDPHIRAKIKEAERQSGALDPNFLENKLPRPLRAKAWFRLSQCFANLEYVDRAREALGKAKDLCDEQQLQAEMSQHLARLDVLERRQMKKQKNQFKGFFEKLQDTGGYLDAAAEQRARWDSLSYEEKWRRVQELDDSDGEVETPALGGPTREE